MYQNNNLLQLAFRIPPDHFYKLNSISGSHMVSTERIIIENGKEVDARIQGKYLGRVTAKNERQGANMLNHVATLVGQDHSINTLTVDDTTYEDTPSKAKLIDMLLVDIHQRKKLFR